MKSILLGYHNLLHIHMIKKSKELITNKLVYVKQDICLKKHSIE